jgi:hypothetical protein
MHRQYISQNSNLYIDAYLPILAPVRMDKCSSSSKSLEIKAVSDLTAVTMG